MGTLHTFPDRKAVVSALDAAWSEFQELAAPAIDNPALLVDQQYSADMMAAWLKWRGLFEAECAA